MFSILKKRPNANVPSKSKATASITPTFTSSSPKPSESKPVLLFKRIMRKPAKLFSRKNEKVAVSKMDGEKLPDLQGSDTDLTSESGYASTMTLVNSWDLNAVSSESSAFSLDTSTSGLSTEASERKPTNRPVLIPKKRKGRLVIKKSRIPAPTMTHLDCLSLNDIPLESSPFKTDVSALSLSQEASRSERMSTNRPVLIPKKRRGKLVIKKYRTPALELEVPKTVDERPLPVLIPNDRKRRLVVKESNRPTQENIPIPVIIPMERTRNLKMKKRSPTNDLSIREESNAEKSSDGNLKPSSAGLVIKKSPIPALELEVPKTVGPLPVLIPNDRRSVIKESNIPTQENIPVPVLIPMERTRNLKVKKRSPTNDLTIPEALKSSDGNIKQTPLSASSSYYPLLKPLSPLPVSKREQRTHDHASSPSEFLMTKIPYFTFTRALEGIGDPKRPSLSRKRSPTRYQPLSLGIASERNLRERPAVKRLLKLYEPIEERPAVKNLLTLYEPLNDK